jgi:hypothetical protein
VGLFYLYLDRVFGVKQSAGYSYNSFEITLSPPLGKGDFGACPPPRPPCEQGEADSGEAGGGILNLSYTIQHFDYDPHNERIKAAYLFMRQFFLEYRNPLKHGFGSKLCCLGEESLIRFAPTLVQQKVKIF